MTHHNNPIPYLTVPDAEAAIRFYEQAFAAEAVARHKAPNSDKLMHAELRLPGGGVFFLSDDFPEFHHGHSKIPAHFGGSPVTLHLDLPDVDAVWATAVAAGATVTQPLADMFWGDRYGQLTDPFGHHWSLSTAKRVVSEAELTEGAKPYFPDQA